MTRIRRLTVAVLSAVILAAPPAAHASAESTSYGVNIQKLVYELPQAEWGANFDAIRDAGLEEVRFDALWQDGEPRRPVAGQHAYVWQRFDPVIAGLARRGLRWLPIIDYSARWAAERGDQDGSPPRDVESYAKFAAAVAARYGPAGSFWVEHPELPAVPVRAYEIWNEPNYRGYWYPSPDPLRYADLYLAAHREIKAVDPSAKVWVGGLMGDGAAEFVRAMYAGRPQLRGIVDAVGVHPYAADPSGVVRRISDVRAALDQLGEANTPIAITEIGWATRGSDTGYVVTDAVRAAYYTALVDELARSDCGITAVLPHTWVTQERNVFTVEDWFGIYRRDGTPNLSGTSYARAVQLAKQRPRPESAERMLCGRVPDLGISRTARRIPVRGRTRAARSNCHVARVMLGGTPLAGVTVRFDYTQRLRRSSRRRQVVRVSGTDGSATVCRRESRHPRASLRLKNVSALRADLPQVTVSGRSARLP